MSRPRRRPEEEKLQHATVSSHCPSVQCLYTQQRCIDRTGSDPPMCNTCGNGYCTADNGCTCNSDAITTCFPGSECSSVGTNACCPTGYYWSAPDNCCTETLICNPACNSEEICTNVSMTATCSCNHTFYSGLSVSSLTPIVTCESALMKVSIGKCLLQYFGYDSNSFQLNNNSDTCSSSYPETINGQTMQTIQALPETGWCGNNMTSNNTKVSYSNVLHIGNQKNSSVVFHNPINLTFSCSYNLTMQTSLASAINVTINTINLTAIGEGSVVTTMGAYWDSAYTQPIQSSEIVTVGTDVYIGITADVGDVSKFVLRTESCIASPDNNVNNINSVAIVSGGCPANQGVTADVQENGLSFESRVKFSSFAFQGQPLVYITCTVRLCSKNSTCTGCNAARDGNSGEGVLQIPINFQDTFENSASSTAQDSVRLQIMLKVVAVAQHSTLECEDRNQYFQRKMYFKTLRSKQQSKIIMANDHQKCKKM
ncbi:uromodulin-like [Mantella aurantiaca]